MPPSLASASRPSVAPMSHHSTTLTTTTTYVLSKYSRSYANGDSEWQHYVNPVIKLVLDVNKSPKAELTSVRLKILWIMNSGNDSMDVDQREIIFEDIELLSFSSLVSNQVHPNQHAQGLPLKAVYRDSVVGIRYLHPIAVQANSTQAYRRFQITFESSVSASQFIDAIRNVCPCRPNNPPSSISVPSFQTTNRPTPLEISGSPHIPSTPRADLPINYTSAYNPISSQSSFRSREIHPVAGEAVKAKSNLVPHSSSNLSLPNSSQPSTNSNSSSMPPPPPPSSAPQPVEARSILPPVPVESGPAENTPQALLDSLRQTSILYSLPRADLETLVSEVVREEGFAKLLEDLDSMWRVKGYLGR